MRIRELRVTYHPVDGTTADLTKVCTTAHAVALFRHFLDYEASEVLMIALLDTKMHLIAVHVVSRGSLDTTIVHPREVFKAALLGNAAGILTAHNHPSGDPTPSPDDLALFRRLSTAAGVIGIDAFDHLIIGERGRYWSWRDSGAAAAGGLAPRGEGQPC